jgi:hypothetical protein
MSVAVGAEGQVLVVGHTNAGLDGNSLIGMQDAFLVKYDGDGSKLHSRQLGVSGRVTQAWGVAADANGNVYVVGGTYGGLGGNAMIGTFDAFVAKYDRNGDLLYTRQIGTPGAETGAYSVATDHEGNVILAGFTEGGLAGNSLSGTTDYFVAKYSGGGDAIYIRQFGKSSAFTIGTSVAVDREGNVHVAGYTDADLDGYALIGKTDCFVARYDPDGNLSFILQSGAADSIANGNSIAADAMGNVFVVGETDGGLDGNLPTGLRDFFVSKYDSNGMKK